MPTENSKIKPFYKDDYCTLYNNDCIDVMKSMPENSIDIIVTSPPYGKLRDYGGYIFDYKKMGLELFRLLKDGGVMVWVVGDETINGSESGESFKQALYFMSIGFNLHDTMIYEKNGSAMPTNVRYLAKFEYMFVFSKGIPKTIHLLKDRKNRFMKRWGKGRVVREKDGSLSPRGNYVADEYGIRFNIWKMNNGYGYGTKDKIAWEHPATFPEALAEGHIKSWGNPGDVVLDPMCGAGTTLKMAKKLNRHTIGIECEQKYCEIAVQRLKQEPIPFK